MIIWGSRAKDKTIGQGGFFCPACKNQTSYSHQRVSRYFTLYFIPLFPTQTLGEYIRCGTCRSELRPEVLRLTREQIELATAPWTCTACNNRNSASERACISCGTARGASTPPPPLPGTAALNAGATPPPPPPSLPGPSN